MLVYKKILFAIFLFAASTANGQLTISGVISDADSKVGIENAIITLLSKDGENIIAYTITSAKGYYRTSVTTSSKDLLLKIAMLGYETQTLPVSNTPSQTVNAALKAQANQLKEVIVKPPRITQRSDTINYNVAAFSNQHDRTIGDILKKLPGIEVQQDGTVLYNGKAINKFYIEGMDLLESKYNIATNGISAKDVNSVQVLENHQPIKALKSTVASDRAALNLKLNDIAKAKWVGNVDAAIGGTPILWNAKGMAMEIAKGNQSLNTFKTNNSGENVSDDLTAHTLEDLLNGLDNNVAQSNQIQLSPDVPPIKQERLLFNKSYLATMNNLWQLKKDYQLRVNVSYLNDRLKNIYSSNTAYYLTDTQRLMINETINAVTQNNKIETNITLNKNSDKLYFNNSFKAQGLWSNMNMNTIGTSSNNQQGKMPYHFLQDEFDFVKLLGKHTLKITAFTHYDYLPQSLTVTIQNAPPLYQTASLRSFYNHVNASYGLGFSRWNVEVKTGAKIKIQGLNTVLENPANDFNITDSLKNRSNLSLFEYYAKPILRYNSDKFNFNLELPIRYFNTSIKDKIINQKNKKDYFYINPSASFNYKYNAFWTATLQASVSNDVDGIEKVYQNYILRNYRNLGLGNDTLALQQNESYSFGITYRNPLKEFFSYLSVSYNPTHLNQLSERGFAGITTINKILIQGNIRSSVRINGRLSKGIDSWKATASLAANYTISKGVLLQQNKLLETNSRNLTLNPKFNLSLKKWCALEYNATATRNYLRIDGQELTKPLNTIGQYLEMNFFFSKQLGLKLDFDHFYNQLSGSQSVSALFSDAAFRFIVSKRAELTLSCTNIFNQKHYGYTSFDNAGYTSNSYNIRPLNFLAGMYFRW